jgi:trimeric autotransporter adhesin
VAGSGFIGFSGDGAAAFAADLTFPTAVAIDDEENLYIADTGNQRVRKVTPDGIIHTVAGDGTTGFAGDGIASRPFTFRRQGVDAYPREESDDY